MALALIILMWVSIFTALAVGAAILIDALRHKYGY